MVCPRAGNTRAAITLKRKTTDIACATSSSSAPITGAVAAMAEPPHIDEPTPIRILVFESIFAHLCITKAITSDIDIVHRIIGSDCLPVLKITLRLRPKPRNTTAV